MNWKKIILAGIVFAIVAQIIHMAEAFATLDFYMDPAYFGVWSKVMMPTAGPPPAEFQYYSITFNVIAGIIYAAIFSVIGKGIGSDKLLKKGINFGLILFMIGVPFTLTMYLLINLPTLLLAYWSMTALAVNIIGGIIIAKIIG